ncbi:ATP-dependent nuclease [Pseudoclavibacter helvolus]|uniref:ATP-dependent nuclease n=1 Tax=Pseudoclavibacter helvolus TaxID=255205 RepID=UPI0024ACCEEA|nr:AAA family ATPase [Pseudoclavibacter helvolus]
MKISKVSVDGYRLLNGFEMDLRDDLSLVIGKNNTGKTSLLNILSAYLSASQPRFAFEDFSVAKQRELLSILASDHLSIPASLPTISLTLTIRYDENDNLRNLSKLMVDLSPSARTVNLRFTSMISADQLERLHADIHANLAAVAKALGTDLESDQKQDEVQRFLSKKLKKYFVRQVVSFDPEDARMDLDLTDEISSVRRVLNLEYVSARRSVENRDAGKGGSGSARALSQLSSEYFKDHTGGNEESAPFIQLAAKAAVTDREFTKAYKEVFQDVVAKVKRFGAIAGLGGDIHVMSTIQPSTLLNDSTSVKYGEPDTLLPEDHNGLGYLNLIAIIMEIEIRLLRIKGADNSSTSDVNLLVIEEPEAHTHPQLQYIFIKKIKELLKEHCETSDMQLQTIITTHSSHITAESDFADIKYFRRIEDRVEARNMTDLEQKYGTDKKQYQFLTQYLTLTRAELFFADKAILIEGDTERILMRAMMRKIDESDSAHESPLGSQNISVVEVGAHSQIFDHFMEFTGLKTLIITDIDSAKVLEDKDGKRKLHASPVSEGTHTTNGALKHFLRLNQSGLRDKGDLQALRERPVKSKQLTKKNDIWVVADDDPSLIIAYQTAEKGYEARSYEDAFIHLNREYIKANKATFRGLKHIEYFDDAQYQPYELAEKCVIKKTHFALDVIYSETDSQIFWKIPGYIAEGLRELRDA